MSLVGSLEDLGLGDILQIISLSRKSGSLTLRSERGEGQILFRQGDICTAELKGEPSQLDELLLQRRLVSAEALAPVVAEARAAGAPLAQHLVRSGLLAEEQLDQALVEHVEGIVLRMFRWAAGEFRFEVGPVDEHCGELVLSRGINPQFLALEGSRLQDEGEHAPGPAQERTLPAIEPLPAGNESAPPAEVPPAAAVGPAPPVIVIEPQLAALEQIKRVLAADFPRVHIFQRSELGVARIRQYLARSECPLVLLSGRVPPDPLSGARDWRELVARLRSQSPAMPLFLLADAGREPRRLPDGLTGVLPGPDRQGASALGTRLREWLAGST